jgi:enoyl-CoA hydratase
VIETTSVGAYRVLTLERPERRNALDLAALDELRTAVQETTEAVLLIEGAGQAFCAGADLESVAAVADDPAGAEELAETGQRTMRAIADTDTVVVAGIDGAARGGGVELALACDVRVATPAATLAEPGVRLGIFGAWGGTHRLPRIVGRGEALDIALSGSVLDAEAARRMGVVSRIVEDPHAVAAEIAEGDPAALRALQALMGAEPGRETAEQREIRRFREVAPTAARELD